MSIPAISPLNPIQKNPEVNSSKDSEDNSITKKTVQGIPGEAFERGSGTKKKYKFRFF
jgi:hypothetical protein